MKRPKIATTRLTDLIDYYLNPEKDKCPDCKGRKRVRDSRCEPCLKINRARKKEPRLSENGSVLPNKFARWPAPFDKYTSKDF